MTRLLCVALTLALATPVSAKTLIIGATGKHGDAAYGAGDALQISRRVELFTKTLDRFGASYVVVPPSAVRTEFCRTGTMVWDYGTSAARTEQFDAVIHLGATRRATGADYRTTYNPESLSTVTKMPTVPQLFVANTDGALALSIGSPQGLTTAAGSASTNACSLGMVASGDGPVISAAAPGHDEEGVFFTPLGTWRWGGTDLFEHSRVSRATVVGKGYRTLLAYGAGPIAVMGWEQDGVLPTNADSVGGNVDTDTVNVHMIQNTHFSGAKPNIVLTFSDVVADGSGGVVQGHIPADYTAMMVALAALDSASGGKVFDNKAKLPYRTALTIDGLCSRSSATNSGGIVPSDTARFYATIDSLAAIGIPFVVGVNLDSVGTYPRDLQYVKDNAPKARFSPQTRAGIDSAAAGNGIAHRYRPVDTFRRYRNIHRAHGPAGGAASDTSLSALLKYSLALMDSLAPGRVSKFALPVDDDWSPYNLRGHQVDVSRGATPDSVLYAYYAAGFRGIRINGSWHKGRPNKTPNNPLGFIPEEGRYRVPGGGSINLLAHNGGGTFGHRYVSWGSDSVAPFSADPQPGMTTFYMPTRLWYGMVQRNGTTIASTVDSDDNVATAADVHNARIMKVACQELAGPAAQSMSNPSAMFRPAWWGIRKVAMPFEVINKVAGRTLMEFAYPEDIVP